MENVGIYEHHSSFWQRRTIIFFSSQEAEAELEAADPPPLLVVDVALVGRAQRRGLPVQHGHSVDGAPVLES